MGAEQLGFDYGTARFGSVDEIYKSDVGRDILAEAILLFADVGTDSADTTSGTSERLRYATPGSRRPGRGDSLGAHRSLLAAG